MTEQNEYSQKDIENAAVFMARAFSMMQPGDTLETAMQKVLERDREIYNAAAAPDVRTAIVDQMAERVYDEIRAR